MSETISPEAGHPGANRKAAARRQGTKPPGGGRRPGAKTQRAQFHLGEKTLERLGVHASLVHADKSRVVDEVLTAWLTRYGRGRELFGPAEDPEADAPLV